MVVSKLHLAHPALFLSLSLSHTHRNAGWVPFQATEPQGLKRVAAPKHAAAYTEALANYKAFERAVVVAAVGKERKV
jgi:hypothetical protein